MAQEHERGLTGWQGELGLLAEMLVWTYDALQTLATVVADLVIDPAAMRRNLQAAGVGEDCGEAAALVTRALENYRGRR